MQNVIFVIHLLACLAMIGVVLLQRSEGGALGIGGSTSSFMTGRGAAGVLVRVTIALGALFFATSLVLTTLNTFGSLAPSGVERELIEAVPEAGAERAREGDDAQDTEGSGDAALPGTTDQTPAQ